MNIITIVGSINIDTTLRVQRMPKPGETIHTKELFTSGGGKGANQAVAAIRSGADVFFIGALGNDDKGHFMKDILSQEGINLDGVEIISNEVTGQAFITVDDQGENSIMIHSAANNAFSPNHIQANESIIKNSDFIVAQLESNLESTIKAFNVAKNNNITTILNPAPAINDLPEILLELTDLIIPNKIEAELISKIELTDFNSLKNSADFFHKKGIKGVIITLGSKGAFYSIDKTQEIIPANKVLAVDTTAAGDTFIGALCSQLSKDLSNLKEAITFGNKASSLTVQRYGAQTSIPYLEEIKENK